MAEQLQELFGLDTPPIAITFHDTLPEDGPRVENLFSPVGDAMFIEHG